MFRYILASLLLVAVARADIDTFSRVSSSFVSVDPATEFTQFAHTTNTLSALLSWIDKNMGSQGTYPVLRLELGGTYTDFELKASVDNFSNLVYYVMSSSTNAYADDPGVLVYFTDDHATDVRKWNRATNAVAIGSQVADAVNSEVEYVVVCPSHSCSVDWSTWMSPTNTKLVWSFVRYDGAATEKNASGTKEHWNPVVPVEWRKARIAP